MLTKHGSADIECRQESSDQENKPQSYYFHAKMKPTYNHYRSCNFLKLNIHNVHVPLLAKQVSTNQQNTV